MRSPALLALLALAACSEGEAPQPKATATAAALEPGQWEVTSEVTKLTSQDKGTPRINTPAGTKAMHTVCLEAADVKKPKPELFAGTAGECTYDNFYMSGGSFNVQTRCNQPGLSGSVASTAAGDFEGTSFKGTLDTTTYLTTDGDVRITANLSGRRTGATCSAAPAKG